MGPRFPHRRTTLRRPRVWSLHEAAVTLALIAVNAACENSGPLTTAATDLGPEYGATTIAVDFDVQMLFNYATIGSFFSFPGGRRHLDDFPGDLIVTGDLQGSGDIVVSFRVEAPAPPLLNFFGHVWADMNFTTAVGDWTGKMNGQFLGDPNHALVNLNMHGPDQQHLKASCLEQQSAPDKLVCSGEIRRPHG